MTPSDELAALDWRYGVQIYVPRGRIVECPKLPRDCNSHQPLLIRVIEYSSRITLLTSDAHFTVGSIVRYTTADVGHFLYFPGGCKLL